MEGIVDFVRTELRDNADQLGQDGKEGQTFLAETTSAYQGPVLNLDVDVPASALVAVKTFKTTKSSNKIKKEAELQQLAAAHGVAPPVYGVNTDQKYIVMHCLDTLVANEYKDKEMPESLQYMLCALMGRLDEAKVMQGDMNALNVMLDERRRPYIIDYGFAKKITKAVEKKRGGHPNICITLWGLVRGFRHYKIGVDILDACVKSNDPAPFFKRGESEIESIEGAASRGRRSDAQSPDPRRSYSRSRSRSRSPPRRRYDRRRSPSPTRRYKKRRR